MGIGAASKYLRSHCWKLIVVRMHSTHNGQYAAMQLPAA